MRWTLITHVCYLTLVLVAAVAADLVVNVRNQGGESYKQTIKANLSDDTVVLYFDSYDGSSTTLAIDFRNEIQVVHTTRLGNQQELEFLPNPHDNNNELSWNKKTKHHQSPSSLCLYRSYCFVTRFKPTEFIPVDAMAKLRQKNPWSLRTPERTEAAQNISFDIMLDATASDWISPVIRQHCSSNEFVQVSVYGVKSEITDKAVNPEEYLRAVRDGLVEVSQRCSGVDTYTPEDIQAPCRCSVGVCIGWYPCALKFCRARNSSNSSASSNNGGAASSSSFAAVSSSAPDGFKTYRCGIHTCRICRNYLFSVSSGTECV